MNTDDDESSASESINLPDDMLILLAKDYIRERDGLSLSLTGENERFASIYGNNRRSLNINGCYFLASLSPESAWERFLNRHIDSSLICYFDASNCYWLQAEDLCRYIHQFTNLEELYIQDTKIRLGHLPKIFKACQKITKLGFTLVEECLFEYRVNDEEGTLDWMTLGFGRLTHLKIFSFAQDCTRYDKSWLVILGVLKWCRSCVDLFIKVSNTNCVLGYPRLPELEDSLFTDIMDTALDLLSSHVIDWMRNLKSLVVLSYDSPSPLEGVVLDRILEWLPEQNYHLEHLWLTDEGNLDAYSEQVMTGSSSPVKSFVVEPREFGQHDLLLNSEQFSQLERLSGFPFQRFDYLPNLKYFRGDCDGDDEELNAFCESHPMLEQLYFDTGNTWGDAVEHFGDGDWKLLSLKVLGYRFLDTPFQTGMGPMIKACPNIEELAVKNTNSIRTRKRIEMTKFYSSIRFKNLVKLSICDSHLFDGSYLPMISDQCPKLESIQLEGRFIESRLFPNLAECLTSASNLRDLRLVWKKNGHMCLSHLQCFGNALLKCSSRLERLVLIKMADERDRGDDQHKMMLHPSFLFPFVKKITRLVCLCLVGFDFFPSEVEEFSQRITEEILVDRPAFWFYVGEDLPEGNDKTVPRVHYDEIVCPIDASLAPPRF